MTKSFSVHGSSRSCGPEYGLNLQKTQKRTARRYAECRVSPVSYIIRNYINSPRCWLREAKERSTSSCTMPLSTVMGCQRAAVVDDDSRGRAVLTEAGRSRRSTFRLHVERAERTVLRAIKAMRPGKHAAPCKSPELQRPTPLQRANTSMMSTREWAVVAARKEHAEHQPPTGGTGTTAPGGPVLRPRARSSSRSVSPSLDSRRQEEARECRDFVHRRRETQRTKTF